MKIAKGGEGLAGTATSMRTRAAPASRCGGEWAAGKQERAGTRTGVARGDRMG